MKSMQVLVYKPEDGVLEVRCMTQQPRNSSRFILTTLLTGAHMHFMNMTIA